MVTVAGRKVTVGLASARASLGLMPSRLAMPW
jgi:hypothetical protein